LIPTRASSPVAKLVRDPLDRSLGSPQLRTQAAHHSHRGVLLLLAVPPRPRLPRHLLVRHDSILVSKVRSLQATQGGSVPTATLHRSRPTNRTQDTVVTPWPGSDRPGAAPSQVFTHFAVLPGAVRLDELVGGSHRRDCLAHGGGAFVADVVVGEDALDPADAVVGEEGGGAGQESGAGGALLVGQDL
jgi:hypothetical protein